MNAKELAAQLNGTEYPVSIPIALTKAAKEDGLVIVYGASDDLMEFEGAIVDELSAWEGATVMVDREGIQDEFDQLKDTGAAESEFADYFRRKDGGKMIEALWDEDGYSWVYKTDIPHETFEVMEDGDKYCLGIVFSLSDLGGAP